MAHIKLTWQLSPSRNFKQAIKTIPPTFTDVWH